MEIAELLDTKPGKLLWLVCGHPTELPNVSPVQFVGFLNDALAQEEVIVVGPWGNGTSSRVQDPTDPVFPFREARRCTTTYVYNLYRKPEEAFFALLQQANFQAMGLEKVYRFQDYLIEHFTGETVKTYGGQGLSEKDLKRLARKAAKIRMQDLNCPLLKSVQKGIL